MKYFLAIFFLLNTAIASAQLLPISGPSQYDAFIKKQSIEWANYNYDTIHFTEKNLSEIVRTRFENGEIKATLPLWPGFNEFNYKPRFYSKGYIDTTIFNPPGLPIFDSSGKAEPAIPFKIPTDIFDSINFNAAYVLQVLYVAHGILRSYVPFVSPSIAVKTSMGLFLGYTSYFSTCFNYHYDYKPAKRDAVIFLSHTKRPLLEDSAYTSGRLKDLYGRNLVSTLWPYIMDGKYKILDTGNEKAVTIDTILKTVALNDPDRRPGSDSIYPIDFKGQYVQKMTLAAITGTQVIQDWYYDKTTNIVFNKIIALEVYMRPLKNEAAGKKPVPVFKIVF